MKQCENCKRNKKIGNSMRCTANIKRKFYVVEGEELPCKKRDIQK